MSNKRHLPLTNTHWGTYRVETQAGKVTALHGFEEDLDPSPIGNGIVDVLDGPSRIQNPVVRQSWLDNGPGSNNDKRGSEPFVEVSWQQASKLVADEIRRIQAEHGKESIYAGSYGWGSAGRFHHAQSQIHRFYNYAGGYVRSLNTYSFASAEVIVPHVLGNFMQLLLETTSWQSIVENSQLIVAFGGMPLQNGQINSGGIGKHVQKQHMQEARAAGIEFINISPIKGDLEAELNAQWIPIRPSTDSALLIGLAHTLLSEELTDQDFLNKYTVGFEQFADYLTGRSDGIVKDAQWAGHICHVPEQQIQKLARQMAEQRTMISVSWSLTRQHHGEQAYWAAITVAAMLGQIGLAGGGVGFGYCTTNGIGGHNTKIPGASLPQGKRPVDRYIPVARISDMLLNPGESFKYNGLSHHYPDIHMVHWAGGNPFHHHQDINKLLKAWRKPDTIVVNEWCWNSLAKHADIVLPCTTSLERNDLAISPRDPYVVDMQKAIEPVANSRHDYDIFKNIAAELGIEQDFTQGRDEQQWIRWIYDETRQRAKQSGFDMPSYSDFKEQGWFKPAAPEQPVVMLSDFRRDPNTHPLSTPSGKIEIFSQTIAGFNYTDCPAHPSWLEPYEWLGNAQPDQPLHLISNQPKSKLHSQLDHGSICRKDKIKQREPIHIHPNDAKARGIVNGDIVSVHNKRGSCLGAVVIDDSIMPAVVRMSTGAWYDPEHPDRANSTCKHGNPNVLTADIGTSQLGQGPSAHTCMVQVEKYNGELPAVTAFDPPTIIIGKEQH